MAIGLARLGHRTALMARLADDGFGALLRAHAAAEHIGLGSAPLAAEPTTLAVVDLDGEARASYSFYRNGTADWQWTDAETARLPADTAVFHMGSLASWLPPGDERILAAAAARLGDAADEAILISALTCERIGADPHSTSPGRSGSQPTR